MSLDGSKACGPDIFCIVLLRPRFRSTPPAPPAPPRSPWLPAPARRRRRPPHRGSTLCCARPHSPWSTTTASPSNPPPSDRPRLSSIGSGRSHPSIPQARDPPPGAQVPPRPRDPPRDPKLTEDERELFQACTISRLAMEKEPIFGRIAGCTDRNWCTPVIYFMLHILEFSSPYFPVFVR
jgi:hypothetical protein